MKQGTKISAVVVGLLLLCCQLSFSQPLTGYNFKIVNMTPNPQSGETRNDAETNIAVNPANTSIIAGSAFTNNPTGSTTSAPIFISSNGGTTWTLNNIVPSGNGRTGDISLAFGSTSGTLYAGILRGGSGLRCMMLRTTTPTASTMMTTLADRSTVEVDQPFVSATTVTQDRLFSGDNLFGSKIGNGGNGRTAEVMFSNNAGAAPFGGFTNTIVEARATFEQDMPPIRMTIHNSGVVYGAFYGWINTNTPSAHCNVVVVRDDNFATDATPFNDLQEAGVSGMRVVTNRTVPAFPASLGSNRLVASNLAIAVDPNNAANVFVAWCDRVGATDYTVHLRRSTNSGATWSGDILAITNATNPGIAITTSGRVGFIYQQLTGSGASTTWETHFRLCTTITGSAYSDDILSTFLDSDLNISTGGTGFLGDYLRIQAVGGTFYGVFPAGNRAIMANFPHSVTYQRNANFTTNQLRNLANSANVSVSVDPFFFKISPTIMSFCQLHPDICFGIIRDFEIRLPEYICIRCPWPCLQCPPFEILIEDLYKSAFKDPLPETVLNIPYFHLFLNGYNPEEFDIQITNKEGDAIKQQLNKTEKGYAISFLPSKNNFNRKQGLHGLKLTALPKNEVAAKKGTAMEFSLKVSDYQFKEMMRNK